MRQKVVPPKHQGCNACGGDGKNCLDRRKKCEVCKGKGYWNNQDIDEYHKKYPQVCKSSCGEEHFSPEILTPRERKQRDEEFKQNWEDLKRKVDGFLKKHVGP